MIYAQIAGESACKTSTKSTEPVAEFNGGRGAVVKNARWNFFRRGCGKIMLKSLKKREFHFRCNYNTPLFSPKALMFQAILRFSQSFQRGCARFFVGLAMEHGLKRRLFLRVSKLPLRAVRAGKQKKFLPLSV
jgi:hypothetical protein